MEISINLIEYMTIATVVTGIFWVMARVRRKAIEQSGKRPLWVTFGADFFGVLALVTVCRVAIADWQEVPTGSMEPTVRVGDRLLVNKLAYGPRLPFTNTAIKFGEPQRGDVVVFRYPRDVSIFYVKRLVGMPNDIVSYDHGAVSVNNQPFNVKVDESIVPKKEDAGQMFAEEIAGDREHVIKLNREAPGARVFPQAWLSEDSGNCVVESVQRWQCKVPPGKYLMMGDNRDNSADSRVWGFLDEREIYGKAVKILVNFHDFSRSWTAL